MEMKKRMSSFNKQLRKLNKVKKKYNEQLGNLPFELNYSKESLESMLSIIYSVLTLYTPEGDQEHISLIQEYKFYIGKDNLEEVTTLLINKVRLADSLDNDKTQLKDYYQHKLLKKMLKHTKEVFKKMHNHLKGVYKEKICVHFNITNEMFSDLLITPERCAEFDDIVKDHRWYVLYMHTKKFTEIHKLQKIVSEIKE